jgi:hypothetical protein
MAGDWKIDGARLWSAGVATALVAGLAAVVVWFFAEQVFDVDLLAADGMGGEIIDLSVGRTFAVPFVIGLAATALLHMLLAWVPSATTYFTWIGVLVFFASLIPVASLVVSTTVQAWLLGMHVIVFLAVVPTLRSVVGRVAMRVSTYPPPI